MSNHPITEDDLHALVDEALDAARQAEVEAYLARQPAVAARVRPIADSAPRCGMPWRRSPPSRFRPS
ncbi:anti-sigma factor [Teichococcus vastitatis]|uniref:hypothetical protein n=1 Tax=Teichococcus vastitatis TaxID=2307076 RepID=UPI000E737AD3|nr:hypothetical protein [Pseudoroseomonas vastitatis]